MFDSAIPHVDINALVSFLEDSVAEGTRYEDGEIIKFGSMLFRVAYLDDSLTLQEPDLQSFPIAWKLGITQSMKLMRLQKDITESVGLVDEIDPPSICGSLIVGIDLIQEGETFILERVEPVDSDSGWFVGRNDTVLDYNDEANLNCMSVYQAILNWPQIAGFLALPAGCRIDLLGPITVFSRNGQPLEVKKGSFIDIIARPVQ